MYEVFKKHEVFKKDKEFLTVSENPLSHEFECFEYLQDKIEAHCLSQGEVINRFQTCFDYDKRRKKHEEKPDFI